MVSQKFCRKKYLLEVQDYYDLHDLMATFHPDQSCIIQKKKIFVSNDTIGMRIKTKIIYHNALLTKKEKKLVKPEDLTVFIISYCSLFIFFLSWVAFAFYSTSYPFICHQTN
ncbi:hypothetical protein RIR_jg36762.t1 [Rhizophagus irregularis DAOM 181602=DAOM 197198]|nr:hypothetical protein RIR_jg36762.t1 [Rhizophagus irregularis DAOM 181602=DAOM 197198]